MYSKPLADDFYEPSPWQHLIEAQVLELHWLNCYSSAPWVRSFGMQSVGRHPLPKL